MGESGEETLATRTSDQDAEASVVRSLKPYDNAAPGGEPTPCEHRSGDVPGAAPQEIVVTAEMLSVADSTERGLADPFTSQEYFTAIYRAMAAAAPSDNGVSSWAQRYDDAVQPLQTRCSQFLAERDAAIKERDELRAIVRRCGERDASLALKLKRLAGCMAVIALLAVPARAQAPTVSAEPNIDIQMMNTAYGMAKKCELEKESLKSALAEALSRLPKEEKK